MTATATPELIVSIPKAARHNDLRWAIAKMVAHAERDQRVANAQRVLTSRSKFVEPRHRELAKSIIDGPGDVIGAKLSHDWQRISPAEALYFCTRCDLLIDAWNGEWCPEVTP